MEDESRDTLWGHSSDDSDSESDSSEGENEEAEEDVWISEGTGMELDMYSNNEELDGSDSYEDIVESDLDSDAELERVFEGGNRDG